MPTASRAVRWIAPGAFPLPVWIALLACGIFFQASPPAHAEDRIWTALLLANSAPSPADDGADDLRGLKSKAGRAFGYPHVDSIAMATKTIDEKLERWLVPSQHFWMCVKSKRVEEGSYLLNVALFHDRRPVMEANVKLGPKSPLFIRGPMHARGQLIIALQVLP